MKLLIKITIVFVWLFIQNLYASPPNNDADIAEILNKMHQEIVQTQKHFFALKEDVYTQLKIVTTKLNQAKTNTEKLDCLIKKDQLKEKPNHINYDETTDINKIRYLKGLSIIKILYEKVLSLDHHFSSVATFSEINKIANPNNYPEFIEVKDLIKNKTNKKKGLQLTKILGNNIYTSSVDLILNLFNSEAKPKEKTEDLKKVECIIDFTLRMNNDLNTIYFETAFLQKSNDKIMQDLEVLFKDYTKPIKYHTPLKECRANDDWDLVRDKLNGFLEQLDKVVTDGNQAKAMKMQVDLNFPIDRLLQFITQYNGFIDQGGKFYEKFKIILNSYENEQQCKSSLPIGYQKLKKDIDIAIEKFNTAYRPVEINGSKMKEILYGINEYE